MWVTLWVVNNIMSIKQSSIRHIRHTFALIIFLESLSILSDCLDHGNLVDAYPSVPTVRYGDSVAYACSEGYSPVEGALFRTCQMYGRLGGTPLVCSGRFWQTLCVHNIIYSKPLSSRRHNQFKEHIIQSHSSLPILD